MKPLAAEAESMFLHTVMGAPVVNVGGDVYVTLRRICSQGFNNVVAYLWLPLGFAPGLLLPVILVLLRKKGPLGLAFLAKHALLWATRLDSYARS
jgi:hypothetical protein